MNYRSVSDLAATIRANLHKIPPETDLIVGIPRSGILAATLVGLSRNLPVVDLDAFIENREIYAGNRYAQGGGVIRHPRDAQSPLILDDSISSGEALGRVKQRLKDIPELRNLRFGAVYAAPNNISLVDIYLEIVPYPRLFEWNALHHYLIKECCIDIDGVLCVDPSVEENDDGSAYLEFLRNAAKLVIPSLPILCLVTNRLEKYRKETEDWLLRHGVQYNELRMLDLPSARERQAANAYGFFKSVVYREKINSNLFIESDKRQAIEIANLSGKHVLCFSTQEMITPSVSLERVRAEARQFKFKVRRRIRKLLKI
jgi:uncharacterized HAD superfamily protein